jgi:phage tail sheath protein FI
VPEYLAPGVYVEEVSFRSKSIEGVGTSTCAFVGPTRKGPVGGTPELLTSFADFERLYGGVDDLAFEGDSSALHNRNHLAHAAQAFYNNGGGRLYVSRTLSDGAAPASGAATPVLAGAAAGDPPRAFFEARFAGTHFNGAIVTVQQVVMPTGPGGLAAAADGSVARVQRRNDDDTVTVSLWAKADGEWQAIGDAPDGLAALPDDFEPATDSAFVLSFDVTVTTASKERTVYEGATLGSGQPQYIGALLPANPNRRADQLAQPIAFSSVGTPGATELLTALGGGLADEDGVEPSVSFTLADGTDGNAPGLTEYEDALEILVALEDVSVVAAPGYSAFSDLTGGSIYRGIQEALLSHVADPRRYRMAVLDAPPEVTPTEMRDLRGLVDSNRAALYYPWVVVANPLASPSSTQPAEIQLPPSGFVCGIYARNDIQRGVFKAPANEVVRGALRFHPNVNFGQQELLNPIGVNCLRYLDGRGFRVWGARTISSDPEWKYVNVRRYFNYLGASIDRGTQWAVFEPNGEMLWANVRGTIGDFLFNEWRNGALLGTKPEEAFFVRCDRTTMTQNDLDNGRLICLIGVAVVKPAEFVIFRIGQKTADAKS